MTGFFSSQTTLIIQQGRGQTGKVEDETDLSSENMFPAHFATQEDSKEWSCVVLTQNDWAKYTSGTSLALAFFGIFLDPKLCNN